MPAPFPHFYEVSLDARGSGIDARLSAAGRPALATAPPPEFDGLPDLWSPEHLLLGAVAVCFHTTFLAIARASRMPWHELHVAASGTLEKTAEGLRFTAIGMTAALSVAAGDEERGRKLLEKAERNCIVSNALKVPVTLESRVDVVDSSLSAHGG